VSDATRASAHVAAQFEIDCFPVTFRKRRASHSFGFLEANRICLAGAPL
jgi:hypothetical protein